MIPILNVMRQVFSVHLSTITANYLSLITLEIDTNFYDDFSICK